MIITAYSSLQGQIPQQAGRENIEKGKTIAEKKEANLTLPRHKGKGRPLSWKASIKQSLRQTQTKGKNDEAQCIAQRFEGKHKTTTIETLI
jgi:hypothetical protein